MLALFSLYCEVMMLHLTYFIVYPYAFKVFSILWMELNLSYLNIKMWKSKQMMQKISGLS